MIIGPFTFQSRDGMQSFQMLNHAISPCNILFKKLKQECFLFRAPSLLMIPFPLCCRRCQAKGVKTSSTTNNFFKNSNKPDLPLLLHKQSFQEAQPYNKPKLNSVGSVWEDLCPREWKNPCTSPFS